MFDCKNHRQIFFKDMVYGFVAQLVRARASHARGRRFEPCRIHHRTLSGRFGIMPASGRFLFA